MSGREAAGHILRHAAALWRDRGANTAITFALVSPLLLGSVGAAIDYSAASSQQKSLQAAADAAALAAARELGMGRSEQSQISSVAEAVARATLANKTGYGAISISTSLAQNNSQVHVNIQQKARAYFMELLSAAETMLSVKAVATGSGTKICVIGLNTTGTVISLESNARLTATNCSVYGNSTSSSGISSQSNALLKAQAICTAGGKVGGASNFSPNPVTDCPPTGDPLASRPPPQPGLCLLSLVNLLLKDVTRTLYPGTYCGGLRIDGTAKITFMPGIYIFKDGPLIVDANSEIAGEYVGMYFTGKNARFRFSPNSRVTLGAPKTDKMAGMLFWQDKNVTGNTDFEILSNTARTLLGTIYLPRGRMIVDANQPIADQSAYTAIVVQRMELLSAPNLVLNVNYDQTDVPVPAGLGSIGGKTRLVQ